MENQEKPSLYAIIPANVRYCKALTPQAKLLYGEISALTNCYGYCDASNAYFARLYDINVMTVSRIVKQLAEYGFVNVFISSEGGYARKIYLTGSPGIAEKKSKNSLPIDKNVYTPIDKNVYTPMDKNVYTPMDKNVHTPMDKNVYKIISNNIDINNNNNKEVRSASAAVFPPILSKKYTDVKIEELDEERKACFDIAVKFQELYIRNLKADNIPYSTQRDAKLRSVVEPIRLMLSADKFTIDDLRDMYRFVSESTFWRSNIRSNTKLREKAQTLLAQYRADKSKPDQSKPLTLKELQQMAS